MPAAAGRLLDSLASRPALKMVMIPLSSVWTGITLLFLIGLYVGIGSGFASWRAKLEMTDLQFFDALPMQVLIALLAANLTIVTLRRIPLTIFRLGVWMVHIGILTLLAGCVWYFSQKNEGSVRIFLNQSVNAYYDATERALYAYNLAPDGSVDTSAATMTPLPGLPLYYEHIAERHNALNYTLPVQSLAALNPAFKDVTVKVVSYYPYAELGVDWVAAPTPTTGAAPQVLSNPAVRVSIADDDAPVEQWLLANSPAGRMLNGPAGALSVEYVYHPTKEQLEDMTTEVDGSAGITVRLPKLHLTRTYGLEQGKTIVVGGTAYTLTPGVQRMMPLVSKGYENAISNTLTVHVVRKEPDGKEFAFDRMVLSRYPERSPDFVLTSDGKPQRVQERVDNDIQLTFQDAGRDQIWLIERVDGSLELIRRKTGGGKVERFAVSLKSPISLTVNGLQRTLTVVEQTPRAVEIPVPQIVPESQRQRGQTAMEAMQFSIIELELSRGDFRPNHIFVPFVQFAQMGEPPIGRRPVIIDIPGAGKVGFLLSTTRRDLPVTMKLTAFKAVKYPGATNTFEDYVSTLAFTDTVTGKTETVTTHLNEPATNHGLYFFQSQWDGDENAPVEKRFSVMGVGNRPGLGTMTLGALLMVIGIGYAFYAKPILLKMKKESLAAWNAQRNAFMETTKSKRNE